MARRYTVDTAQNPRAIAISMFGAIYMFAMDREVHQAERNAEDATRAVMLVVDWVYPSLGGPVGVCRRSRDFGVGCRKGHG